MESEKVKVIKACLDREVKDYQSEFSGMCLTYINELESVNERKESYYNAVKNRALEVFANRVKMEFYYEFDELIPSIMADKIDKILKELKGNGND